VLLVAGLTLSSASALDQPASAPALLAQLHQQLQQMRSMSGAQSAGLTRSNLAPLVGLERKQIASALGEPDFCLPQGGQGRQCRHSARWAYFFFQHETASRETSGGMTEITLPPLGGWAMELHFAGNGTVENAQWVKQE
jgi:hypothetical protein